MRDRRTPVKRQRLVFTCLVVCLVATPVVAHVPGTPANNDSPGTAYQVSDPAKSWSFYDELGVDGARYYSANLQAGDRLTVGLFTPDSEDLRPSLVVMRRGGEVGGTVPDQVTVPDGYGARVIEGERPGQARFEPFTPGAYYHTVGLNERVEEGGQYLLAVYEPEGRPGNVGVAIGHQEQFTVTEYLTVPWQLPGVLQWSGYPLFFVVGGTVLLTLAGLVLLWRATDGRRHRVAELVAGAGALLVTGSALDRAVHLGAAALTVGVTPGMIVTVVFVALPFVAGAPWILKVQRGTMSWNTKTRSLLALSSLVGVVSWGGYLVGPVLLLAPAVTPFRRFSPAGRSLSESSQ